VIHRLKLFFRYNFVCFHFSPLSLQKGPEATRPEQEELGKRKKVTKNH